MKHLRCFIAIDLPDGVKSEVRQVIDSMRKCGGDIKWVDVSHIHITLKFLGNTAETAIHGIQDSLRSVVSSCPPFCITIYGTGVFPNRKHPRVIWAGIEDSETMKNLKQDIENAMTTYGYQKEDRDFAPHLTLGRVRSQKGIITTLLKLDSFRETLFGRLQVDTVKLMKSELRPQGPEYTCISGIPLGSGNSS